VVPFSWADHVARLSELEFKKRYRLTVAAFNDLLAILRPQLEAINLQLARNSRGTPVAAEIRLACALRFLAGGMMLDLSEIFRLSMSECYRSVWRAIDGINGAITVEFPIDDLHKLDMLEREFRATSKGQIWAGQVGAVDGVHFKSKNPGKAVPNPRRYFVGRKDCSALLCIAVCDSKRRFTFFDISQVATTHDSTAWARSKLGVRVLNDELPQPFFINGDNAFVLSNSMIVPSGAPEDDDFDYYQSSARMPIECAFGILVRRWGVLWRPLEMRFNRRAAVAGACMRLHNFCIDRGIGISVPAQRLGMSEIQPGRWQYTPLFDKDGAPVEYLRSRKTDAGVEPQPPPADDRHHRRDILIRAINDSGLKRPARRRTGRDENAKRSRR
jgi:hypothetical protein